MCPTNADTKEICLLMQYFHNGNSYLVHSLVTPQCFLSAEVYVGVPHLFIGAFNFFPFSIQYFAPVLWNFSCLNVSYFSNLPKYFFCYCAFSLAWSSRLGANYAFYKHPLFDYPSHWGNQLIDLFYVSPPGLMTNYWVHTCDKYCFKKPYYTYYLLSG